MISVMKLLLLGVCVTATLMLAAPAWADGSPDVAFVDQLNQIGLGCSGVAIKCDNDQQLVGIGHSICYDLDTNGDTPSGAAGKLNDVGGDYMSKIQARELVGLAVAAYCSWDLSQIVAPSTAM